MHDGVRIQLNLSYKFTIYLSSQTTAKIYDPLPVLLVDEKGVFSGISLYSYCKLSTVGE